LKEILRNPMDQQEGMSSNRAPLFKGNDYAFWSIRMKIYLMALGCDVWLSVENGYTAPTIAPSDDTAKKLCNDNSRDVNAILGGLENPIFVKVMHCKSKRKFGTNLKSSMKEMEKLRKIKFKHTEGNLKSEDERGRKYCRVSSKSG
jgi:hypothetical protein